MIFFAPSNFHETRKTNLYIKLVMRYHDSHLLKFLTATCKIKQLHIVLRLLSYHRHDFLTCLHTYSKKQLHFSYHIERQCIIETTPYIAAKFLLS